MLLLLALSIQLEQARGDQDLVQNAKGRYPYQLAEQIFLLVHQVSAENRAVAAIRLPLKQMVGLTAPSMVLNDVAVNRRLDQRLALLGAQPTRNL